MHTRCGKLLVFTACRFKASPHSPSRERRRSKKRGTFYARGARRVTYRQPDHSSGFVMKGQCGAAAVACVFRVQSIILRGVGRMPKMGLLSSLKESIIVSNASILQLWLSFRCCGNV